MMYFMDLSISFWGYALEATVYVLKKIPSKSISNTLYEIWKGKRPSLKYFKIWSCPAYVKNVDDISWMQDQKNINLWVIPRRV